MTYERDKREHDAKRFDKDDEPGLIEIIITVIGAFVLGWFVVVGLILATCFLSV